MAAAEPLYVLADTAIVGHIGTIALGGLGLASIVLTTSSGLCNVLTWWTTSRVGFLRGAGDEAGVHGAAGEGGVFAMLHQYGVEHLGVLERFAHDGRIGDADAVIGEGDCADIGHVSHLGQLAALALLGRRPHR